MRMHAWPLRREQILMADNHDKEDVPAIYANYFRVGYNSSEFLFDFGRHFEGEEERIYQRIITTPSGARELNQLLGESIRGYEEAFGPMPQDPGSDPGSS